MAWISTGIFGKIHFMNKGYLQNEDWRPKTKAPKPKAQYLVNFKSINAKETVLFALSDAERHSRAIYTRKNKSRLT